MARPARGHPFSRAPSPTARASQLSSGKIRRLRWKDEDSRGEDEQQPIDLRPARAEAGARSRQLGGLELGTDEDVPLDTAFRQAQSRMRKIASISTGIRLGSEAKPTADRACLPFSPSTATKRSEQPLMTFG